jgi:predicted hydrocarbon binding protein
MMEMGTQIGWGRAEAYGSSSSSVCHLTRGDLSGMASIVFGQEIEAMEFSCLAKGDECCRFEIM